MMAMIRRQSRLFWFILALAILIRAPLLSGSFWLDEAAQALESVRPLSQQLSIAADFQPPFFHFIVHFLSLVSRQEWWLRLSSVVPSILTIVLTYRIARRSMTERSSLVVASTIAFSGLCVYFSQELRPYSWAVFWAVLSWDLFERRSWRWLALGVAAGLYTSYVFLFWPVGLLAVAASRRILRKTLAAVMVAGIFFLAWYPKLQEQLLVGSELQATLPSWDKAVSFTQMKALPLTAAKFLVGPVLIDLGWRDGVLVGGTLLALIGGFFVAYWRLEQRDRQRMFEATCLFILPLLAAWLFSFFIPVIQPKRVLYLFPALAVIFGWFWQSKSLFAKCSLGLFFLWQIVAVGGYWLNPTWQREDWRTVVSVIEDRFSPGNTAVIFAFSGPFAPWEWYNQEEFTTFSTGLSPLKSVEELQPMLQGIKRYRYVIVFDYLRDLTDPYHLLEAYLDQEQYSELGIYQYPNIGNVRVFEQNQLYAGTVYEPS